MKKKLCDALEHIDPKHIAEAAAPPKKKTFYWLGGIAAVLAVAIFCISTLRPVTVSAFGLVAAPEYPKFSPYPEENDAQAHDAWWQDVRNLHNQPLGYAGSTADFFRKAIPLFLDEDTANPVCSPLNIYMALAMLAETTGSESRQQLLSLLGSKRITDLRTQAGQVWKGHYWNDGMTTSILGSSLWLDQTYAYRQDTIDTLADNYYASVYRGDLGSDEMTRSFQSWLNEQTGGLLEEQVENVEFSDETSLAIATTILYKVQWQNEFNKESNTTAVFHGRSGDTKATFMNRKIDFGTYYWGEDYGAVGLHLEDDSTMWLILPDEGKTPRDLLASGHAMELVLGDSHEQQKSMIVNLSLPKFDICADMDLIEDLKVLGVTDIFDGAKADFSPLILGQDGGWVSQVKHAARVGIDEKGVTAAAFTVILRCGAAMPPNEEIDFILDRPFLFVIESADGMPLFAGAVNEI